MTQTLTPLQKAFLALQDAEARIDELEGARGGPIAVIGLGCRAPGGVVDADSFWRLLEEERDATGPVPTDRWNHEAFYDPDPETPGRISTRGGGFLDRIDGFDPEFFGITPREASGMDPQQRLLLEVCWEALENAGQAPTALSGTPTGVFIGAAAGDYAYLQLQTGDPNLLDAHFASGMAHSVMSGRVSYLLGLQGPALTIDTACSSSLVAIHTACQSLRAGECRMALAGGVNLILAPDIFIALSRARMLAPDGRCKTFDAAADGFARGEGCAIVALKRLEDAEADGDRVLAVIRGAAINQDGPSSGLTAPNGTAQEAVIRAALDQAGLAPGAIGYIEAHGTGTELGDPLEARALGAVFAGDRDEPLLIGSVKTNLGHLEGAAGAIALVKTILSLRQGVVPAHLHLTKPSAHIAWDELKLTVSPKAVAFPEIDGRKIAGVSSFGFSGTNAHIIVEAPPQAPPRAPSTRAWALPISAPDAARLTDLAAAMATAITPQTSPADLARTLAEGRAHLVERAVVRADSAASAKAGFEAVAAGLDAPGVARARTEVRDPPRIAFLFTGQGSQYSGMGAALYDAAPAFRAAFDDCDALLQPLLGVSIKTIVFDAAQVEALNQTGFAQPALFAYEYALAAFWRALGVEPVAAMGHSVGEYVAACVSGAMSLEDAITLIAARARLMQSLPAGGAMAAVFAPEARVAEMLARFAGALSLAAINGPAQVVVSGEAEAVKRFCAEADATGVKTRALHVSHAFHSPLMDPILDAFQTEAGKVTVGQPAMQLISNLTGRAASAADIGAPDYWRRHLRSPVRFADGLATLAQARVDICLEIGPQPTLTSFAAATFDDGGPKMIASQRREGDGWEQILDAVAQLHLAGVDLDWSALDPERLGAPIDLPLSAFKRERYWFKADPAKAARRPSAGGADPILGQRSRSAAAAAAFELHSADAPAWVAEHRVLDQVIAPGAMLIEMMRQASGAQGLSDIELSEALAIDPATPRLIQTIAADEDGARRTFVASLDDDAAADAPWRRHASATVATPAAPGQADLAAGRAACPEPVDVPAYYDSFAARSYAFGPLFHSVTALWKGQGAAVGEVKIPAELAAAAGAGGVHPVLLDGCLQVAGAALPAEAASQALLPVAMAGYHVIRPLQGEATAYAQASAAGEGYRADIAIYDQTGALAVTLSGVRFVRATRSALSGRDAKGLENAFYAVNWREADATPSATGPVIAALADLALAKAPALAASVDFDAHEAALARVEALATPIILRALGELGWTPKAGDPVEAVALAVKLGVASRHHRLFTRLLQILGETGVLAADGAGWRVVALPDPVDATAELDALAATAPSGAAAMASMTCRVGAGLSGALAGDREPMDLLFPAGATDEAVRLYRDSAPAAIFNGMLAEAVAAAASEGARNGRFEVMEIGAGTGGTTARVIDRLPAENLGYLYTDIGATFVAKAQDRFGHDPRMDFTTFDLERDLDGQGLEAGRYDLIIAANVIHATADLRSSLARIRSLLKPNGMLALMEVVEPQRWFDLTVGLTSGWWAFTDLDIRPDYPTLTADGWRALLTECGFDVAVAQPSSLWPSGAREALILARVKPTAWAVLADDEAFAGALAAEIEASGRQAAVIAPAPLAEQLAALAVHAPAGVVVSRSPDVDAAEASADLAALAGALAEQQSPPRLVVLTRGGQSVSGEPPIPQQAPAWGVARSLALESPDLHTTVIDLDAARPLGETAALAAELANPSGETQLALRGGKRLAARLERRAASAAKASEPAAWRLTPASAGSYDAFVRAPLARRAPGKGEVEIETVAWGLNFKDVLNALDLYPGDPGPLGGESAGRIVAVGEGVEDLRVGDEVMAVAGGSFSSHVTAPAALVQRMPPTMSFEEAATFPIPWLTAAFCLEHVAQLRAGERVLIHAGAGGVGLAAIRLAQRVGARVFATAGSPWKRDLLAAAGVTHIYDSRTPDFADQILADTEGEGVQVVLNSLAGDMMDASFRAIAKGGRFVEIGKNGLKDQAWVDALGRGVTYEIIDWGETAAREPDLIGGMLRDLVSASDQLPPLPRSVFSVEDAGSAFRVMAQARHAGKIVLRRAGPATDIRADGTYLVSGGLSGVGLETARWLATKGAGRLVLFGRKGLTPAAEGAVAEMRAAGAEVWAETLDVADRAGLSGLLARVRASGPPLRGVFHSAGTLDNAALASQNKGRFDTVFRAKHDGAAALDALTRVDPIEMFVLYSSVASVLGAAGQINHAAANAYMDALAHERRSRGLPALSVNWGAWSEVGAAANAAAMSHLAGQGMSAFTTAQGLAALERLLADGDVQATVARIDWPAYLAARSASGAPAFLSEMAKAEPPRAFAAAPAAAPVADGRAEIDAAPASRRPVLIAALVTRIAAGVVGFAADRQIDPRMPLSELGLDSLMAVDLRNKLGKALGHRFSSTLLFDYPAIGGLSEMIGAEVFGLTAEATAAIAPRPTQTGSEGLLDAIEGLDDDALDRLLAAKLGTNT